MGTLEEAHNVSGEQTIVLGHGFGTDQSVWKHLVPHLVDNYRVIVYDNMGVEPTNPDYFDFERYDTLEGYAYDLLAILEEFRVESCYYLGHSLSSMTGVIASIFHPDLFHKIILMLQEYTLETAVAVITDGGATLKVDTQHLKLNLRPGSLYEFFGELHIEPSNEAILKARVGRNVDGLDLNLYHQSIQLLREFQAAQISSRTA